MSATDLTLAELRNKVYRELKVPSTSEAYTSTWIDELLNEGYYDIFNQPKKNVYLREATAEFMAIPDINTTADVAVGDTTINVTDTTDFSASGTILINQEFISYTGKTATSFTGCSGVGNIAHSGDAVRATYALSSVASDMDEQQIRQVLMDGIPFYFMAPEMFLQSTNIGIYRYSIMNGRMILQLGTSDKKVYVQYFKNITLMTGDTDKPSLIPNSFRIMLVYYAVGRAMMADDMRTGWEAYYNYNANNPANSSGLYFKYLRNFYAKYGRRVDQDKKYGSSIFD